MYHVFSTAFTVILLYLVSFFLYRTGYYTLQLHRKFWNSVLLAAFITTATAGLFLSLQINYKWNVPFIKEILKWHVEFGIGLAITGIFHLIWHLNYYGKFFNKISPYAEIYEPQKLTAFEIKSNLLIVGFVSSSMQLLLMREIMNIAGGYELITGSFLGSWLIGSALGAALASRSILNDLRKINLVFSLSPLVTILLMLLLSRIFLNPGETPSFLAAIIYAFIVLIPLCLVSGFTFIKLITTARNENIFSAGKSFSIETAGGIISGLVISFLTCGLLGTYKLLSLIILLSIAYSSVTYYCITRRSKNLTRLLVLTLGIIIILFEPDILFRQILFPAIKVTDTEDTPYGNITSGEYKGERSLYYNHRLLSYNNDVSEREEDIHYAMLQSESPEKVIIISGYLKSLLPEILKYDVKSIIYIERDPYLTKLETSVTERLPANVAVINRDAYRFIRNSSELADVIILLVPPPSTLLLNRYYTIEFFESVKKSLKPGAVFMCSPGPGDNYLNKESLNLYSSIYNSLKANFRNVKPVVGNKLFFVASDRELSLSYCKLLEKRGIKNIYVSPDFLDDALIIQKSEEVNSLIETGVKQNKLAFPVACFHTQAYQLSKNLDEKIPVMILLFAVFVLPITLIKRRNLVMYFSASALAGFEIIILLTLQVIIGNMYQFTGLIIAGLMTGLAVGSGINLRFFDNISPGIKVILLVLFYVIFGLTYNEMIGLKGDLVSLTAILITGFIPSSITGRVFRELTLKNETSYQTSSIYSADLAGSAFGFIFISGFAVPVLGIQVSVYILSALTLSGVLFGTVGKKS
jgi:spermidine synthase